MVETREKRGRGGGTWRKTVRSNGGGGRAGSERVGGHGNTRDGNGREKGSA